MNLAVTLTRSTVGIRAQPVSVEVHLSNGLPNFTIVGLAETAVKESKDRVRSAIINSQFEFPCRRITVNLAPANLPKTGSGFDLPIAIGILAASNQIPMEELESLELIGELALSGAIRGVNAIVPAILAAHQAQHALIIGQENAREAAIVGHPHIYMANNLREVCSYLRGESPLQSIPPRPPIVQKESSLDWSDIKGQQHAKQAMLVAATGGHSVLLSGAPGSGKTMLASRFPTLLPLLSETQALECAAINSIRGQLPDYEEWRTPPFRAPHHTASPVALVGGGNPPKPGEISLAHHGVLFLDELPEFGKQVLETLRQPLESGSICISRAASQTEFPASFQLIAAMNPCPCGHFGNPEGTCLCSPDKIIRYLSKISGPLLDRIDIQLTVHALPQEELLKYESKPPESALIRERIASLQELQFSRQQKLNAKLNTKECEELCALGEEEQLFLKQALSALKLSARGYHRLLKVSRTIADLNKQDTVNLKALKMGLSFKQPIKMPQ